MACARPARRTLERASCRPQGRQVGDLGWQHPAQTHGPHQAALEGNPARACRDGFGDALNGGLEGAAQVVGLGDLLGDLLNGGQPTV